MEHNPYAAPVQDAPAPIGAGAEWSPVTVFEEAWNIFRPNWVVMVVGTVLYLFVGFVLPQALQQASHAEASSFITAAIAVIGLALLGFAVSGYTRLCLAACRGQRPEIGLFFAGRRTALMALAILVEAFIIGLGLGCLVVPGLFLSVVLSLTTQFLVDTDFGLVQSMKASAKALQHNFLKMFGFFLLGGVVVLAGLIACGVGALVTYPVFALAWTIIYLRLSEAERASGYA